MKPAALLAAILSLSVARVATAACAARPTDAGYPYAYPASSSFARERVRVHWATSGVHAPDVASTRGDGVPDTVAYAAEIADAALARYAALGFRSPPPDGGCGGDERLDVYLVRFQGADGATVAECTSGACGSHVLVESTFRTKGYGDAREGFRTVVSHELFHAVQNAYRVGQAPFWAEGTAQWAMKKLHPDLADFERQLPSFFEDTSRSIDAAPGGVTAGFLYGSAVWPLFLALTYGDDVIRETFEEDRDDVLSALDVVLGRRSSSLAVAYPAFATCNAATGALAGTCYPSASTFPGVKTLPFAEGVSGITSGLGYFVYRGVVPARQRLVLDADPARNAAVVVPIEGGVPRLERRATLPAEVEGEVLVVVSGITTKKTDAPYTLRFAAPPAETGGCRATPRGEASWLAALVVLLRRRRR